MGRDKEIKCVASCESVEVQEAERSRMYHLPKPRKQIIRQVSDLEGDEWLERAGAQMNGLMNIPNIITARNEPKTKSN